MITALDNIGGSLIYIVCIVHYTCCTLYSRAMSESYLTREKRRGDRERESEMEGRLKGGLANIPDPLPTPP